MRWAVAVLLSSFAGAASALEFGELWQRPDQRGMQLLEADQPDEAARTFQDPRWRGVGHYRAGDYAKAAEAFAQSGDDLYNQATSAVRAGDYQTAIEQYEQLLAQDPEHDDARHNLDIARQLAGQDPEQSGQSGDQNEPGDQESEQDSESQNQPAEQDGDGQQQSQDQQSAGQQGEQSGEQSESDQRQQGDEGTDSERQDSQDDGEQSSDAEAEQSQQQEQQMAAAEQPVSEVDQATEQWLRRIPDDPAQLLRGKIRLKHRTDYRDVGDMVEPW